MFSVYEAKEILHTAEFGVILLLFLIGLELRPKRLWSMRTSILGLGGGAGRRHSRAALRRSRWLLGQPMPAALFIGLALSLSSTAFALQVLEEKGELTARHGRAAFSVLLFQDLAAIPLIALAPLFAVTQIANRGADGSRQRRDCARNHRRRDRGRPLPARSAACSWSRSPT